MYGSCCTVNLFHGIFEMIDTKEYSTIIWLLHRGKEFGPHITNRATFCSLVHYPGMLNWWRDISLPIIQGSSVRHMGNTSYKTCHSPLLHPCSSALNQDNLPMVSTVLQMIPPSPLPDTQCRALSIVICARIACWHTAHWGTIKQWKRGPQYYLPPGSRDRRRMHLGLTC